MAEVKGKFVLFAQKNRNIAKAAERGGEKSRALKRERMLKASAMYKADPCEKTVEKISNTTGVAIATVKKWLKESGDLKG